MTYIHVDPMKQDVLTELYAGVYGYTITTIIKIKKLDLYNFELIEKELALIGNEASNRKNEIYANHFTDYEADIANIERLKTQVKTIYNKYIK